MNIKDFIKAQAKERAEAAAVLESKLYINGIEIEAGCTEFGIKVENGLELLNQILHSSGSVQVKDEECSFDPTKIHRTEYIFVDNVRFYHDFYIPKEN